MIVKLEKDLSLEEIEVLIKYAQLDPTVEKLEKLIRGVSKTIQCVHEGRTFWLNASDIYYIESVDKHTFIYDKTAVYESQLRLYQLLDILSDTGFVQVSKACLININLLDHIKPLLNSRIEATMINGERIYITRKYLPSVRKILERRSTLQ